MADDGGKAEFIKSAKAQGMDDATAEATWNLMQGYKTGGYTGAVTAAAGNVTNPISDAFKALTKAIQDGLIVCAAVGIAAVVGLFIVKWLYTKAFPSEASQFATAMRTYGPGSMLRPEGQQAFGQTVASLKPL